MPKVKFSAKKIQHLKPAGKSIEYIDDNRKRGKGRFGIRVSPAGLKSWFLQYKAPDGKIKRYKLGEYPEMSLAVAEEKADAAIVKVKEGKDPQAKKQAYRKAKTMSELWEVYCKWERDPQKPKSAKSRKEEKSKWKRLIEPIIGNIKIVDINSDHIKAVTNPIKDKTPVNANRVHALLSIMFTCAMEENLVKVHPVHGVKKAGGKERCRNVTLSDKQLKTIWPTMDDLSPNMRDIFRLILLTGQRPGEVSAMEWEEINFDRKFWTIPSWKTKTDNGDHVVPLSEQVLKILQAREEEKGFVFKSDAKSGHTANTSKARLWLHKETGIDGWTAHDLRRTARTLMSLVEVQNFIAERILNHAVKGMEAVYNQYDYLKEKRNALNKLGREIDRINGVDGEPGKVIQMRKQA